MEDRVKVRLEAAITKVLMDTYDEGTRNYYDELNYSDLSGIFVAKAMDIVRIVREAKQ